MIDMIVREFANGFWFFALMLVGMIFLRYWFHQRRNVAGNALGSLFVGLFLLSAAFMRFWAWVFLWQANHQMQPTFRDSWWIALASVAAGSAILPFLVYRITPPREGHKPWIVVLCLSWGFPVVLYVLPFLLNW